ncbi:MAG: amylo-alpha-1,6-glucosidase [Actinomycetota bacterium]|nr:amylo-alpha-1,6-glucosidase [Actinomycetota bacterium]HZY65700.1 glycogen debranching N-terminal domain-containing protein [Rubrobacteraceae bacterium]
MLKEAVSIVSPGAYAVSRSGGDILASEDQGLFYRDTRYLSKFILKVNGASPTPLGYRSWGSRAEFLLTATAGGREDGLGVARRRALGTGMWEEIIFTNETGGPVEVEVELECAADFRDVFEVRGYERAEERGELSREAEKERLRFAYRREGFRRGTVVRVSSEGVEALVEPGVVSVDLFLEVGEERAVLVCVEFEEDGREIGGGSAPSLYDEAPALETDWEGLRESWARSVEDLESLAFDAGDGLLVPAAGAPWYMALFGRDSLITGYQTMLLGPESARNTLKALVRYQADDYDDYRDAEPGKVPHELRFGELAHFGEVPHSPYYGTIDATPLFLILLEEHWRWTANEDLARELEEPARKAADWILNTIRSSERGYISYERRSFRGLENHGWKDSPDSVLFHNGKKAKPPISLCEVQGYAYDALLRTAGLAERIWGDERFAAGLRDEAETLKERFERDFWIERRGCYALALDGEGRQVDSLTSNVGHLFWSGIVPEEKARAVVDRLIGKDLFSGWGIRTMAVGEGGYDPESYHNGSVWPHDNALIAEGLRRYGFREEASRIARALLEAAPHFGYRLPELFAGYQREAGSGPTEIPRSCSPQAWAAGAVPLLVRTMLGLEPVPENRKLSNNPCLPTGVSTLRLDGVAAFQNKHEVEG